MVSIHRILIVLYMTIRVLCFVFRFKRETIPLLQEKKYTIQATYTTGIKENHTGQKCKNRYRQKPK